MRKIVDSNILLHDIQRQFQVQDSLLRNDGIDCCVLHCLLLRYNVLLSQCLRFLAFQGGKQLSPDNYYSYGHRCLQHSVRSYNRCHANASHLEAAVEKVTKMGATGCI